MDLRVLCVPGGTWTGYGLSLGGGVCYHCQLNKPPQTQTMDSPRTSRNSKHTLNTQHTRIHGKNVT
jgi:hypothetical protein